MKISRHAFLKYCLNSSALLGLDDATAAKLSQLMTGARKMPAVIWLYGSGCMGCAISLTNLIEAEIYAADVPIDNVNPIFCDKLMPAAGSMLVSSLPAGWKSGDFILVVEGGIPTAFDGMACMVPNENGASISMKRVVEDLAPMAKGVICVGACACFGGVSSAGSDPTQVRTVTELTGIGTLNIPGCPPHPDWIAGALAATLCGDAPNLDAHGRPTVFYGSAERDFPNDPLLSGGGGD